MSRLHHLQLITDPRAGDRLVSIVESALGSVDSVQLRDRAAPAGDLLTTALALARAARGEDARLLINDRVDVALAVRAHGVHLPARGIGVAAARALLEPWQLVGVSVHSVEAAVAAARSGADYVTFGHVYPTPTHGGEPPRGTGALADVVASVDVPVLAIGGIDAARVPEVLATGCAGIAVIAAVISARDPGAAAATLREALDGVEASPRRPFRERRD